MKTLTPRNWLIALLFVPAVALSQTVVLTGKTESKVTARVFNPNVLEVTDEKGGWFANLEMQQLGGWDTPYEVQARLRVVSTNKTFQVRLDDPLTIRNQSNPAQVFRSPKVTLGREGDEQKVLSVGRNTQFSNPEPPEAGVDTVGHYTLAISAYPPEGDFRSSVGAYSGVLSMTFEPVVKAP
ncbi:hypothetical protein WJ95_22760 [Burkholderia ubonensis]|uniref:Fimbrial assembly protein n=1 Tax=Burkholderia ubonensis TaxID=101571 RepID=A0AA40R775_9BURK|nr:hypothetical protein [Burkholderia ubonensis]KVP64962.1 hypothetical protein WJ93_26350 [Burkholderia ubonensis]KVP81470.1 hypothetical protein WJ95_22760 [Burkholderia ubonensis]KVQ98725.1 hypothetical protein WK08_03495 [Burkholderia ubonensis]KVT71608.1 hypothetical protein WK58_15585 [Burkholderia ubonensis]KVU24452.1 hypothetical protein WK64_27670 [Burkholderia ubonensis]